jgi:hypothetical protein
MRDLNRYNGTAKSEAPSVAAEMANVEPNDGERVPMVWSAAMDDRACKRRAPYPGTSLQRFPEKKWVSARTETEIAARMAPALRADVYRVNEVIQ